MAICIPQTWAYGYRRGDRSRSEGVYLEESESCWWCSTLKAVVAILKLIRCERPARHVADRDFCATTRAMIVIRRARFDVPVRCQ